MKRLLSAAALAILSLSSCATQHSTPHANVTAARASTGMLRIASWNLDFLAERNDAGCHPRQGADYARMKGVADRLGADVIAFEEAENPQLPPASSIRAAT